MVRPTPSSAPSRGAARGIWLLNTVAQDCVFCLIFLEMHDILFSLCYAFAARHFPPRGTVGCATFPFRVGLHLFVSPPHHGGGLREGFEVGFPCHSMCLLLQFAFLRLAPPLRWRYTREVFDGGLSYHIAHFSPRPPPSRWRYAGGF